MEFIRTDEAIRLVEKYQEDWREMLRRLDAHSEKIEDRPELKDRVTMHNWSLTRQIVFRMEVGQKKYFPPSEINNARTSIQRLKDIYPEMDWKTKKMKENGSLRVRRVA